MVLPFCPEDIELGCGEAMPVGRHRPAVLEQWGLAWWEPGTHGQQIFRFLACSIMYPCFSAFFCPLFLDILI